MATRTLVWHRAFIGLGSNLGDREGHVRGALRDLAAAGDVRFLRGSSLVETDAVGGPAGQGRYLNGVAEIETSLTPRELLERLLSVEAAHGRVRAETNGPRTLDLDLLLYNSQRIDEPGLRVPHPRMWERGFVLEPLAELRDVRALRLKYGVPA